MRKILLLSLLFATTLSVATAQTKLTKEEAKAATDKLLSEREARIKSEIGPEWQAKELTNGNYKMKFDYKVFGDKPADGRALYISMHGGGGTTPAANDKQWDNQKKLYTPVEGVYFVPRSPTDTWNMWHQFYMDGFVDKIVQLSGIYEDVNPNKIYIMGYSAGGDGTFQMAPRMADHWAAAAMMAGHPGNAQAINLRNLPFALYMGGADAAYNRNGLAKVWSDMLDSLASVEKGAFIHDAHIYEGMPHWMGSRDTVAMSWMPKFTRNPLPTKVMWAQDDVSRDSFYWLYAPPTGKNEGTRIEAEYDTATNSVNIIHSDAPSVVIGLNDKMVDLDKPVTIKYEGTTIFKKRLNRSLEAIESDINAGRDRDLIFPVKVKVMHGKNVTIF